MRLVTFFVITGSSTKSMEMNVLSTRLLMFALVLLATTSSAATHFIRSGGTASMTGSGACAGWTATTACNDLPAQLIRGDVYCLADGTYQGRTFDTPSQGTTRVTIRKAVDGDGVCAIGAGWQPSFGDGQANFTGSFLFTTDHYLIDGATRNESDWSNGAAYGFRFPAAFTSALAFGHASDFVTIRYSNIGPDDGVVNQQAYSGALIYLGGFTETVEGWVIQRNYVHNGRAIGQHAGVDGILWELNWAAKNWEKTAIRNQVRGTNVVIRNNVFKDTCQGNSFDPSAGGCTAIVGWYGNGPGSENFSGSKVYGNVFWDTIGTVTYSDAVIVMGMNRSAQFGGTYIDDCTGCAIYQNTFVGMGARYVVGDYGSCGFKLEGTKSGSEARNNLWYGVSSLCRIFCLAETCTNNATVSSGSIFRAPTAGDFHLTLDGIAGTGGSLPAPFNVDADGVTRGAGVWDVGAFEYRVGGGSAGGGAAGGGGAGGSAGDAGGGSAGGRVDGGFGGGSNDGGRVDGGFGGGSSDAGSGGGRVDGGFGGGPSDGGSGGGRPDGGFGGGLGDGGAGGGRVDAGGGGAGGGNGAGGTAGGSGGGSAGGANAGGSAGGMNAGGSAGGANGGGSAGGANAGGSAGGMNAGGSAGGMNAGGSAGGMNAGGSAGGTNGGGSAGGTGGGEPPGAVGGMGCTAGRAGAPLLLWAWVGISRLRRRRVAAMTSFASTEGTDRPR